MKPKSKAKPAQGQTTPVINNCLEYNIFKCSEPNYGFFQPETIFIIAFFTRAGHLKGIFTLTNTNADWMHVICNLALKEDIEESLSQD